MDEIFTNFKGELKNNEFIKYKKGVSLLTCPYFIAYNLYITNQDIHRLSNTIDIDSFFVNSYPYIKKVNNMIELDSLIDEDIIDNYLYLSFYKTNAYVLYSYFQNCDIIISIDSSCEFPSFQNKDLKNILKQNPKHELFDKTIKQIKNMRYDAIEKNFRGGKYKFKSKKIIKRKFKRKTKKYF